MREYQGGLYFFEKKGNRREGGKEGDPNLGDALQTLGELEAADELVHAKLVLVLGLADAEDGLRG